MNTVLPLLLTSGPYAVSPEQVPVIEDAKSCYYIGSSSIPNAKDGNLEKGWSYNPMDIFWCPVRHPESNEHIFGVFRRDGKVYIRGCNQFDGIVQGLYIPVSNILIYSVHVHDYFCAPQGPRVCVDGGRDYLKIGYEKPEDFTVVKINLTERTYHDESGNLTGEYILPCSSVGQPNRNRSDGA